MQSSTVRSALDPTIAESTADQGSTMLTGAIISQWEQSGQPDMVVALRQHPLLLRKRSLLLNLAIEEYKARRRASCNLDLEKHCDRFQEFGSSIQRSIQRQLEVQRFIDEQPELLEELCAPKWPAAGEEFGRFHVLEELGFGSIAHIYLCLEGDVGNRAVVVKATPFPSFEASILGRLNHRNIIPIYSTGFVDERELYYLCMPYCGRSTLSDVLDMAFEAGCPRRDKCIALAAKRWTSDDKRLPQPERRRLFVRLGYGIYVDGVLKLAIQIADALGHAHQQGILHGDLKPSNVLLAPDGKPLLLDFNLSQDYANASSVCGGTLPYMPPEHLQLVAGHGAQDKDRSSDATSDIYSFGALLFELLAGVTPINRLGKAYDASTMAKLLLARIQQGVGSIRHYNPLVSRRLDSIVLRCLAFDRHERPATMEEVKHVLQRERRSLAAVGRQARVRPVVFSAAVGLPLAVLAGTVAHIATQPPRYLANFEQGLQLASEGEADKAAEYFTSAVAYNPLFVPARFELGRSRIALGDLDLALNEFGQLARSESDAHSMAYLGYCFNLKRLPVAAIPWYEKAIRSGATSTAIYNNLGASYLDASTHLSRTDQLRLAEEYLHKALESSMSSPTVMLNIMRHAVAKSKIDSSYDPFGVWRQVQSLILTAPKDPFVESHVALWYGTVYDREAGLHERGSPGRFAASEAERSARKAFAAVYQKLRPGFREMPPADISRSRDALQEPSLPTVHRYFIEPLSIDPPQS